MIQKLIPALLLGIALGAQAAPVAPAQRTAPFQAAALVRQAQQQSAKLIARPQTRLLAYYDADWNETPQASEGGYYRMLVGFTAQGQAVVQDFYQNSRTKQVDPFVIPNPEQWRNPSGLVSEGMTVRYNPDGSVRDFFTVRNGSISNSGNYTDGRLTYAVHLYRDGSRKEWLYYPDGRLLGYAATTDNIQKSRIYDRRGKQTAAPEALADYLQQLQQLIEQQSAP